VPPTSFAFTNLPDGRVANETGRNGTSTLSFTYDANGNQLTSVGTVTTTNTYYADSLLRTAQDGENRTTNYAYDGSGKVTGRNSVPSSGTTYKDTIAYNDADLQSSETNSIGVGATTWVYDAGARVVQIAEGNADLNDFYYAADGTLTQEQLANNVPPIDTVALFNQTLDGDFRVTSDGCTQCSNTTFTGDVGHTFTYQYDGAGRLIFISGSGGAAAYQTYDQNGNRITHDDVTTDAYTNYTYNADNSIATTILSGTPVTSTYSNSGVLTSDGCNSWTLDTFDRGTTFGPKSGRSGVCPTAPPSTTYQYDANGGMVTATASATTTIHNDARTGTPIVETTSGVETVYGRDSNGTPLAAKQSSTTVYLTGDHLCRPALPEQSDGRLQRRLPAGLTHLRSQQEQLLVPRPLPDRHVCPRPVGPGRSVDGERVHVCGRGPCQPLRPHGTRDRLRLRRRLQHCVRRHD
jgi:YD repeat-containing protein